MPHFKSAHANDGTLGSCCACGTPIPACEPIYEKLGRCYFCGRFNPVGPRMGRLLAPACVILALAAFTVWWGQAPL